MTQDEIGGLQKGDLVEYKWPDNGHVAHRLYMVTDPNNEVGNVSFVVLMDMSLSIYAVMIGTHNSLNRSVLARNCRLIKDLPDD